ncbi:MAG: glutamine-hydrolyzing GMP synthase [Clostridiaceae bacterium]|nr:glutamine-hydrolyzing GMP synthase [Clostridiaceae bacterium]
MKQDMILILDLGSNDNAGLAREIRGLGVYSEIHPHDITGPELAKLSNVRGIILNGGPNRKVNGELINASEAVYQSGLPLYLSDHQGHAPWPISATDRRKVLEDFIFQTCRAQKTWNIESYIADQVERIRRQVGNGRVLLALSGGVDSSVVAALLVRAIGDRLTCVHVNHGLMRKGESEQVVDVFQKELNVNLIYIDATDRFLDRLTGIADPEQKRKIIGGEFVRIFEEEARKQTGIEFLGQGTIYSDVIESGTKTSQAIKSHHNVGGLPEDLHFELVEPVKMLFKDEVRAVGLALGLPQSMVYRQPFPGPGLAVRCLGAITRDRLTAVRESDAILHEELEKAGLDQQIWQFFTVVPDFRSTGIKDGKRSFEWPVIVRAVNTVDAMTADVPELPWLVLRNLTERITREVPGVNRVLYDLTPKPTGTIEWE